MRNIYCAALGIAVVGAPAWLITSAASAQEAASEPVVQLEEVVVTARKKTERLLDVPVSGNALSAKSLAKYATTDLTAVGV